MLVIAREHNLMINHIRLFVFLKPPWKAAIWPVGRQFLGLPSTAMEPMRQKHVTLLHYMSCRAQTGRRLSLR
jgi:hypothetical protein